MSYPQGNFYPQGSLGYPQGTFGHPQGIFGPREGFGQQTSFSPPGNFGSPGPFGQQTPFGLQAPFGQQAPLSQGYPQQQPAVLQLLAHQLAAQQLAMQQPWGATGNGIGLNGIAGTGPHHQLLQLLAQYHYLVAQQLTQLAQQASQTPAGPYAGQFIPGSLGANFVPGLTMH